MAKGHPNPTWLKKYQFKKKGKSHKSINKANHSSNNMASRRKRVYSRVRPYFTRKNAKRAGFSGLRIAKYGVALSAARNVTPDLFGKYQGAVDKVIAGGALKLFKQGGSSLIEVGMAEGVSNLVDDFVIPTLSGLVKKA